MVIAILFSLTATAQVSKVSLQASGLTCSMCSNSINKSLKTLDFVEKVDANIKTSTFEITFKPNSSVDFDLLKKKVENAGFSVSRFVALVHFDDVKLSANRPVKIGDKTFEFVNAKEAALNGDKPVQIIDKGFVSAKEYKKNTFEIKPGVVKFYHVII